jgi:hypothetical protein
MRSINVHVNPAQQGAGTAAVGELAAGLAIREPDESMAAAIRAAQASSINGVYDVPRCLLPEGVSEYRFDAGAFWDEIEGNFIDGMEPKTRLTADQIDALRKGLPWLEEHVERKTAAILAAKREAKREAKLAAKREAKRVA